MDRGLIEQATAMAGADDTFRLNAAGWDGALVLSVGEDSWRIPFDGGVPQGVEPSGPAGGDTIHVSAEPGVWAELLSWPPPPGLAELVGATATGQVTIDPLPGTTERHLALTRFGELLRHAALGTDPAPVVEDPGTPPGTFDAAVGRYVHLRLDGLDHRVYFEEAGQGIGLMCQHTAGADGRQWRRILEDERVTSRFRVVVYDLPYHGKSLPPEGRAWWAERYSLTMANAMALPVQLADVLGLERPVFIGSSVGGMLALDLARYHPEAFRAAIALEGGLKCDISPEELAASVVGSPDQHAAVMLMIMSPTAPEASRQETRLHYSQGAPGVFAGDIDYYGVEHDLRGEGPNFDTDLCAVHLLTGEYDFPTMPWTEEAAAEIPGATMQVMEGLGHFPMSEDYEGLMEYVLPILDEIAEAAE